MNNHEFSDWVMHDAPTEYDDDRFPLVYEDEDGDRVEFLISGEERISERVDGRLTVYRGRESGEIVGGSIKGLNQLRKRLLSEFSGFAFCVQDGRVELTMIVAAALLKQTDAVLSMHYRQVFDAIKLSGVTVSVDNGVDGEKLCEA